MKNKVTVDKNEEKIFEITTKRKRKKEKFNNALEKFTKKIKFEANENNMENEENNSNILDDEDLPSIEVSIEESDKFNGKFLRNAFQSPNGLSVLQIFITICNKNNGKDLAAEYLQAGGNILEILRLIDTQEMKNINNISLVFSAICILIIKISAQYPQYHSSAEEACRHLINMHLASIHSMLSSQGKAKHRKIILKLLTAVVTLGGNLPRELLNHLSLHNQLLEVLVSHCKPTDPDSVRTCYIYFVLSFFINGNSSDIRTLLDKRGVLSSIFSGLIYDYSNIVQIVLNTVKKYVLENPMISKTIKLHVFSTSAVQDILNLYDWKGPKNWSDQDKKRKILKEYIDEDEKEITVDCVHKFLITLLTSTRHGIAFHDRSLGTGTKYKHNQLLSTILLNLDRPWEHQKQSELVIKILIVCPDLIKLQLAQVEPFLTPKVSTKWITVIHFITKIINNIDIQNALKWCSIDMTEQQLINAILNLILPPVIIKNAITPSLEHSSPIIHYEIVNLLISIIKKIENLISSLKTIKFSITEYSTYENTILEHILKHMPNFETILNIWIQSISSNSEDQGFENQENFDFNLKEHLLAILNLLQAYSEVCPEILLISNFTKIEKRSVILFTGLCNLQNIKTEELVIMKVKAIKILLFSNISGFLPNENIFSTVLSFLASQVGNEDFLFDFEIRQTINLLFEKCGVFEGYNDEIEIWIDGVANLKSSEKLEIANWITKRIKSVFKNIEKYTSLMLEAKKNVCDEIIDVKAQENIFNELSERNFNDVKAIFPMIPITSISIPLYAAIEDLKKKSSIVIGRYMSIILVHTLHCQISLKDFIFLIKDIDIPMQKYFTSWLNANVEIPNRKPFKSNSIYQNISRVLIYPNKNCKVYSNETKLFIQINNDIMSYTPTNFEIKASFRMVIFYLVQSLQKNNIELQNIVGYSETLLSLIQIADKMKTDSKNLINYCSKWIFKNPIFLQYFKGIYIKNNTVEKTITALFIKICSLFFNLNKQCVILRFMYPYQDKFITQLKSVMKQQKVDNFKKEVQAHVELINLLQLNLKVCNDLLSIITNLSKENFLILNKPNMSVWGIMINKLIERFFTNEVRTESGSFITLQKNILKKLLSYWIELKISCVQGIESWENSLNTYLHKFPHSISTVDEKTFTDMLKTNITSETAKILNLLTERNPNFIAAFIKSTNDNKDIFNNKSFIFSTLSSNLKYKWDEKFLTNLCDIYNADIINYFIELKSNDYSWIQENTNAMTYLIDNYIHPEVCNKICSIILSNGNKLDEINENHVKLLVNIFKKTLQIKPDALKDFVQVLVHVIVISLKKDSKNIVKLDYFCKTLINIIIILKQEDNFTFEELNKNYSWCQFTRISLKLGLKISKENYKKPSVLLKALAAACEVAYIDGLNQEYVKTIFEMTTSHSEFINIMLSNENIKSDLIELLWILIRKNPSTMLTKHIPLYLASYNATLNRSDQFLLKILQHYEYNGIRLDNYRPYLWSSAAASHYSVKSETDMNLWRQPTTSQVLEILIPELVTNTIKNFPIKRTLKYDFKNAISIADQVYDPAFYLPLFNHLLSDNNIIACHKVIHSGALALAIVACSSLCKEIRLAAFTVISRFYFHLEATRTKEKILWIHFIDTFRNGILKIDLRVENIRLNGFVANFLARTSFVMTQPLNPLYSSLQTFLMAKQALDLNKIPELLQLYYSSEIEYQAHRHWILEVISDGLQCDEDMDVALKCVLFKMLFDFYTSTLSDVSSKNHILQVVRSATKLSKPCLILVSGYALLPWLIIVSKNISKGDIETMACIIDIVNNILFTFDKSKLKDTHHYLMILKILLNLKLSFSHNLTMEYLKDFIDILNKTIINKTICNAFTMDQMSSLINLFKTFLGSLDQCESILQFGCKFVKKHVEYECNGSPQDSLYKLITNWYNYIRNN